MYKLFTPITNIDKEMSNHRGLFRMYVDSLDNSRVYQSGRVVEDLGYYCYIVELKYTLHSFGSFRIERYDPDELIKAFKSNSIPLQSLTKEVRVNQIVRDGNSYTSGHSLKLLKLGEGKERDLYNIQTLIEAKADFGLSATNNRIIKSAISMYKL